MGDCPRQEGDPMIDLLLALVVAIAVYLVYAIIFPERF
ncbi:MAG: K(+)-transporting ATPase subunit F [Acidiferrobacteraceae bacterium]